MNANSSSRQPPPNREGADPPRPFSGITPPFDADLLGRAWIEPDGLVLAGTYGTWKIVFVCGVVGVDDGGHIRICERQVADWERPQFSDPSAAAYTTAATDGQADIELAWFESLHERPFRRTLLATVANGSLRPGERVEITLGDTSGGGPGRRAQTFREPCSEFQVHVDPFGAQRYFPVEDHPALCVLGDAGCAIELRCGSQFAVGEPFELHLRVVDRWGNSDEFAGNAVALSASLPIAGLPDQIKLQPGDRGVRVISGLTAGQPGRTRFTARALGLAEGISNPVHIGPGSADNLRIRWGDLHGQSRESVGTLEAADYFRFARDDAFVEFVGHQANDFQITNEFLATLGSLTRELHRPGRFIPFFGWEWSGNTTTGGDRNVHFLGDHGPLHRSSHALLRDVSDATSDACPVSELYDRLAGRDDVLLVPHVGGRYANLDFHDRELEPVIEIHSAHGTFEWLGRQARARGLNVGYFCGSDVHVGRPGAARPAVKAGEDGLGVTGGLAAVLTPRLDRRSIFAALRARRCYGTTGVRMLVDALGNGEPIGSNLALARGQPLRVSGFVDGTAPIQQIDLLCDWEPVSVLRPRSSANSRHLRITWKGAASYGRRRSLNWSGRLTVHGNSILAAHGVGFDHPGEGLIDQAPDLLAWRSATEGDYDGIEIELREPGGRLEFISGPASFELDLDRLGDSVYTQAGAGIDCQVQAERVSPGGDRLIEFDWELSGERLRSAGYHLRIIQSDCNMAWTSPFYLDLGDPEPARG